MKLAQSFSKLREDVRDFWKGVLCDIWMTETLSWALRVAWLRPQSCGLMISGVASPEGHDWCDWAWLPISDAQAAHPVVRKLLCCRGRNLGVDARSHKLILRDNPTFLLGLRTDTAWGTSVFCRALIKPWGKWGLGVEGFFFEIKSWAANAYLQASKSASPNEKS